MTSPPPSPPPEIDEVGGPREDGQSDESNTPAAAFDQSESSVEAEENEIIS